MAPSWARPGALPSRSERPHSGGPAAWGGMVRAKPDAALQPSVHGPYIAPEERRCPDAAGHARMAVAGLRRAGRGTVGRRQHAAPGRARTRSDGGQQHGARAAGAFSPRRGYRGARAGSARQRGAAAAGHLAGAARPPRRRARLRLAGGGRVRGRRGGAPALRRVPQPAARRFRRHGVLAASGGAERHRPGAPRALPVPARLARPRPRPTGQRDRRRGRQLQSPAARRREPPACSTSAPCSPTTARSGGSASISAARGASASATRRRRCARCRWSTAAATAIRELYARPAGAGRRLGRRPARQCGPASRATTSGCACAPAPAPSTCAPFPPTTARRCGRAWTSAPCRAWSSANARRSRRAGWCWSTITARTVRQAFLAPTKAGEWGEDALGTAVLPPRRPLRGDLRKRRLPRRPPHRVRHRGGGGAARHRHLRRHRDLAAPRLDGGRAPRAAAAGRGRGRGAGEAGAGRRREPVRRPLAAGAVRCATPRRCRWWRSTPTRSARRAAPTGSAAPRCHRGKHGVRPARRPAARPGALPRRPHGGVRRRAGTAPAGARHLRRRRGGVGVDGQRASPGVSAVVRTVGGTAARDGNVAA